MPPDSLPEYSGDDGYLYIVADGMGGMAAGEVASRLAISTSLKLFQRSERWGFRVNHRVARELFERISQDMKEIDKTLTEHGASDRRLLGMGTTMTAAYSMGIDLFIIHLGDSRVYLYRDGVLQQLTKDHTVAQAMADAGYIPPDQVRRHVKRNALTNFLGGHNGKVKADLRWLRLADGDRLLLCSDGLNEMVRRRRHRADPGAARRPPRGRAVPARGGPPPRGQGQCHHHRRPIPGPRRWGRGRRAGRRRPRRPARDRRPTRSPGRPAPPNEPAGRPPSYPRGTIRAGLRPDPGNAGVASR